MKKYISIVAVMAALISCQKESGDHAITSDNNEIQFDLSVPSTKVTATAFEAGDQVAIYAVEYNGSEAQELQIAGNFLNNERITYDGISWQSSRKLYWSSKSCDFYALYPYQDLISVDEHYLNIVPDQNMDSIEGALGGYEASDFMWAKATDVCHEDGKVDLSFKHLMSKCVVTITKGEKFEGEIPDDIVAHIYNTTTSAVLDFAAGSLQKDPQGARKTITMKKISNQRFEAIVVPQYIERRTPLIEVTMGGIAYLLEYSLSFKPGYVHTIDIIVNTSPDQEKIEISVNAGTEDWRN